MADTAPTTDRRERVNSKKTLEFHMDSARLEDMSVNETQAIGDIMAASQTENEQRITMAVMMNTRHLRRFAARFMQVNGEWVDQDEAYEKIGELPAGRLWEVVQMLFQAVQDTAVPPTNAPESNTD